MPAAIRPANQATPRPFAGTPEAATRGLDAVHLAPSDEAPTEVVVDRTITAGWCLKDRATALGARIAEPRRKAVQRWHGNLWLDSGVIQALVEWIAEIDCHVLTFNDLHAAVRLIEGVCGRSLEIVAGRMLRVTLTDYFDTSVDT